MLHFLQCLFCKLSKSSNPTQISQIHMNEINTEQKDEEGGGKDEKVEKNKNKNKNKKNKKSYQ